MDTEEIVIPEDAPGAPPMPEGGLGSLIGLLAKFGPAIQQFVSGLISGTASFKVSYHGLTRWVSISDHPPAEG
jgi:hypothetical protein